MYIVQGGGFVQRPYIDLHQSTVAHQSCQVLALHLLGGEAIHSHV